jgi:hypothetical protein
VENGEVGKVVRDLERSSFKVLSDDGNIWRDDADSAETHNVGVVTKQLHQAGLLEKGKV